MCIRGKEEDQYAVVICVFPSISVNSAFLIHSEIHRHTRAHRLPPQFQSFSAFVSAGLRGARRFNLFAVIDLSLTRSYV